MPCKTEHQSYGYRPRAPQFVDLNNDFIRIILAFNKTDEMVAEVMADKAFHDECRNCFNNPPSMVMEPAWILSGLSRVPEGLLPE